MPGVLGDYVTLDQGSGIVHTAPGHGAEDFSYGAEIWPRRLTRRWMTKGGLLEGLPEYKGKTVFEANPIVIALLKSRGALVGDSKFSTAIRTAGAATIR